MDDGKQVFIDKLQELKVLGDPAVNRFKEDDGRSTRIPHLEEACKEWKAIVQQPGLKYQHVDKEQLKSIEKACDDTLSWLSTLKQKQDSLPKHEDPVLTIAAMDAKNEELTKLADSVLGRGDASPAELPGGSPTMPEEEPVEKPAPPPVPQQVP